MIPEAGFSGYFGTYHIGHTPLRLVGRSVMNAGFGYQACVPYVDELSGKTVTNYGKRRFCDVGRRVCWEI